MKVIDLLNKIANGEKVPKKVRFAGIIFEYDKDDQMYGNEYKNICDYAFLNDTVEIIEEEKKIPEKLEYYDDSIAWVIDDVGQLSDVDKVIIDKLNEVLDYLKSKGE